MQLQTSIENPSRDIQFSLRHDRKRYRLTYAPKYPVQMERGGPEVLLCLEVEHAWDGECWDRFTWVMLEMGTEHYLLPSDRFEANLQAVEEHALDGRPEFLDEHPTLSEKEQAEEALEVIARAKASWLETHHNAGDLAWQQVAADFRELEMHWRILARLVSFAVVS